MTTIFHSQQDFFQAMDVLIARLEADGHQQAAAQLRDGFRCLNGLTDGLDLFLESIEGVQATLAGRFDPNDRWMLEAIRVAVHAAIYRR